MSSRREKIMSLTFKKKPKNTNLQEIWSRGLDYKNFPTIFENKNEYANSARYIQDVDTFKLSRSLQALNEIKKSDIIESPQDILSCKEIKRVIEKKTLCTSDHISPTGAVLPKNDQENGTPENIQDIFCHEEMPLSDDSPASGTSSVLATHQVNNNKCKSNDTVQDILCQKNKILQLEQDPTLENTLGFSNADFVPANDTSPVLKISQVTNKPSEITESVLDILRLETMTESIQEENLDDTKVSLDPYHNSDDSLKDADFRSDDCDYSSSDTDETMFLRSPTLCHAEKNRTVCDNNIALNNDVDAVPVVDHCDFLTCKKEVFSTCGKCMSYLCWEHFAEEITYNDCKNHKLFQCKNKTPSKRTDNPKISSVKYLERKDDSPQHCEYLGCDEVAASSREKCNCLLCLRHFCDIAAQLNCENHKIMQNDNKKHKKIAKPAKTYKNGKDDLLIGDLNQHCEYQQCKNTVTGSCFNCNCLLCLDHIVSGVSCAGHIQNYQQDIQGLTLTRKGEIRKRKLPETSSRDKEEKKKSDLIKTYKLKDPCSITCRKKCTLNMTEEDRVTHHGHFWNLDWESQNIYIKGLIDAKPVARRLQIAKKTRQSTFTYHFLKANNEKVEVCKKYFLTSLGFDVKNDSRIMDIIKKPVSEMKTKRGKYVRTNIVDRELVRTHIKKYNPTISHYRREHAPNRLYLPSDINMSIMFLNFCDENPDVKISIETYRKILKKDLNVSFSNLGHEECEQCAIFQEHDKEHVKTLSSTCPTCKTYTEHKRKYTFTRQAYQNDVKIAAAKDNNNDTIYYSADLQKVIMLPRIDQYKTAIFCTRLVTFNECFVPLGSACLPENLPFAATWNESISGRMAEDIISTYRAFFVHKRDVRHIVLWVDNCSAQNKNWNLLTFLVYIVNSDIIAAESITLKFFESGHTFMSADSFHHQIEQSMRRKGKVYDFEDFVHAIRQSNSGKNVVKSMQVENFYTFTDLSSQPKLRKAEPRCYLKDIMWVKATRGDFTLKYKSMHDQEQDNVLDFLMPKYVLEKALVPQFHAKSYPEGISPTRKQAILEKLVPLIPENRRQFWRDLPVSNAVDKKVKKRKGRH